MKTPPPRSPPRPVGHAFDDEGLLRAGSRLEPPGLALAQPVHRALRQGLKSALARWVLHKQREADRGAPDPSDEATHPWDGRRRFAEDYTFVGIQAGLGCIVRLEWLPGREAHRVWVTVLREDGTVMGLVGGQRIERQRERDRWRAGGLELDCTAPYKTWTIRYAGRLVRGASENADGSATDGRRCSLDLTFTASGSPFHPGLDDDPELLARRFGEATWEADLLRSVRRVQNRGYVQLGELHGTVALGNEIIAVRSACLRQHTWGVRDWGASDEAFQCFAAFDDGRRIWVHHAKFPFVTLEGGFVHGPHGTEPVRSLGSSVERRPERAPGHVTLNVEHQRGSCVVQGEMLADLDFVVDGRGAVSLGFFRLGGGRGWGFWGGQRRVLPRPLPSP